MDYTLTKQIIVGQKRKWRWRRQNLLCAKEFSDPNFNQAAIGKVSIFQEIASNLACSQKL